MEDLTIEDVKRLRLEPGDTLAVLLRDPLDEAGVEHLAGELRRTFPDHKTLVLSEGTDLGIVSRFRA